MSKKRRVDHSKKNQLFVFPLSLLYDGESFPPFGHLCIQKFIRLAQNSKKFHLSDHRNYKIEFLL